MEQKILTSSKRKPIVRNKEGQSTNILSRRLTIRVADTSSVSQHLQT